mmetsp:Transcript_4481/g.14307  ORF Transcript_4481/g.14307 Transcript_4481/m.14307 type:complete len:129 (-) Transcript_4481:465-851(-)
MVVETSRNFAAADERVARAANCTQLCDAVERRKALGWVQSQASEDRKPSTNLQRATMTPQDAPIMSPLRAVPADVFFEILRFVDGGFYPAQIEEWLTYWYSPHPPMAWHAGSEAHRMCYHFEATESKT